VAFAVEQDEVTDAVKVGFLGAQAVVAGAEQFARAVEELGHGEPTLSVRLGKRRLSYCAARRLINGAGA
jgi:hypothetical protein